MIDLGFSGRKHPKDPIHSAISRLTPGDALHLNASKGRWELQDSSGNIVGRLAKQFSPPEKLKLESAQVNAVVHWRKEDDDQGFERLLQCNNWEVVVPELVFSP